MFAHLLLVAAMLYHHGCRGEDENTTVTSTTAAQLTSQVGGYVLFECPVQQHDVAGGVSRPIAVVKWTKDVSALLLF